MSFSPREQGLFALQSGDVLVSEGAGSLAAVGAAATWQGELPGTVCFQNTLLRLRPRQGVATARFVSWWARHAYLSGVFAREAGGANIFHLSVERIRRIRVTFPDISIQELIADWLDRRTAELDASIIKAKQLAGLFAEQESGLIAEAALRGVDATATKRQSSIAWIGDVPSHWDIQRIKTVARLESGHTPRKTVENYWEDCTIPWISLNDLAHLAKSMYVKDTRNYINERGLAGSSARILPPGTVVLSRDATIGRTAILEREMATSQHFVNWVCDPNRIVSEYLYYVFRGPMQTEFKRLAMGSTIGTVGMPEVNNFTIPLPPIEEQHAIVARCKEVQENGSRLQQCVTRLIDCLIDYRSALITAAVTGEIDVRDQVA